MTRIDKQLRRLDIARKRLVSNQGRIARRNARLDVLRSLRGIRDAMNVDYPKIGKPKRIAPTVAIPPTLAPPKAARPKSPKEFGRAWDYATACLFIRLTSTKPFAVRLIAHEGARIGDQRSHEIYIGTRWTSSQCWRHVVGWLISQCGVSVYEAWTIFSRFWHGPIETTDIQAAAEHLAWLEKKGVI